MQLRDYYSSLDELCRAFDLDKQTIEATLGSIDYIYDPSLNSFV